MIEPAKNLHNYNSNIIEKIASKLKIKTNYVYSSDLEASGIKDEYLCNICKELGATTYLSAPGSKAYMNVEQNKFISNEVELIFNNFEHPQYPQLHGEFLSHLSIIDTLLNVGFEQTRKLIL